MKPSITRINVIPLYILINILMAQVTTALPFHLWDLSCEDGTLKVSLANKNNAKITPNEITDSNNNKNVWEQLSQTIADDDDDNANNDNENRLTEKQAMLTTNDMLRQAAIAAAAENITKQVQAAGVTIKNGIRLPTLMQAGKFETRQTRKIPKLGTLDQAVNEYDDDDEQPNENIDSFLAGIDNKYGTRDIVNEIVKRVLKETPTTKEEKEAAKASERFKTLQQESNRRNKNKNRHKKTKGEEESEVICTMKCKSKNCMEKPKSHENTATTTTLDQTPKQIEREKDKNNDEKSKDNEKEFHKEKVHNKKLEGGVPKKPKTKTSTKSNEFKWPGDQTENALCKMKCKTMYYDTLRNELMAEGVTKRPKEKSKNKEDSDEKDKEHLIGSYNNYNDFEAPPAQPQNVVKISTTTTEEPNITEDPNAEDAESTSEESVKNATTEKPNPAEDQVETETTKDRKKPKEEKSEIEEYIDDGEQEKKYLSAIDYSEQLENPTKVETALRRNTPNAEAYASFAKILNYENDDWYKKLMTDDKYTRLQNNLQLHPSIAFNTDKFKKSLSLNIGDGAKKPPKQYHTIKISGKLTEEDEDREEKEEKEKKQKEEEEKALKEMQQKEQLKAQVKEQLKDQLKDQQKEQLKVQQKAQLNDQQKEKTKDQPKEQEKALKEKIDKEKEKELNAPKDKDKDQKEKVAKLQPKEKEEKEKLEKLLPETTVKPSKGEEDDDDSDYFTNWPVKTARIMLLKTINAEILELEGIRNRTLLEFQNDKNETIPKTTPPNKALEADADASNATTSNDTITSTTPSPTSNDTTTDACITTDATITTATATTTATPTNTTESTSVSNTTAECIPDNDVTTTTTEEPNTNTTKTDTNCETTTKADSSTFKSMALQSECVTPTPKTPYSLLHKRRHGKSNRKTPQEVNDGILLLPFKKYYNTPIESKAEFKREKPYRLLPRRPTPDNDEADEEFDEYDDDDEDEIDENTKWQTRREQQQDDYDTVAGNNYDETNEPEIKNSGKTERTSKITVMVGKNDKSDEICDDDEADDSEKKSKDEPKTTTTTTKSPNPPTGAGGGDEGNTKSKIDYNAKCEDTTTKKAEDSAGDLNQEIPAPCGDLNSKSSLENIIKVSSDIDLPNTKKLALQDLRGINSGGNAIMSTPHLEGVAPQREFSRERELFRIMSGLVGNHEKSSSKDSAGDAGTGQEECKKTVKQPERRFFIF